jgi:hypothetical protein
VFYCGAQQRLSQGRAADTARQEPTVARPTGARIKAKKNCGDDDDDDDDDEDDYDNNNNSMELRP